MLACLNLQVERPQDYNSEAATLLGPTEPNPAVYAAIAGSGVSPATVNGDACSHAVGSSFASAVRSASLPAASGGLAGRASATGGAAVGAQGAGAAAGAACSKGGPRDLMLPADQSKQDEVFIGGLPSNWKAQQVGNSAWVQHLAACRLYHDFMLSSLDVVRQHYFSVCCSKRLCMLQTSVLLVPKLCTT